MLNPPIVDSGREVKCDIMGYPALVCKIQGGEHG
jgi:hypothetical protein